MLPPYNHTKSFIISFSVTLIFVLTIFSVTLVFQCHILMVVMTNLHPKSKRILEEYSIGIKSGQQYTMVGYLEYDKYYDDISTIPVYIFYTNNFLYVPFGKGNLFLLLPILYLHCMGTSVICMHAWYYTGRWFSCRHSSTIDTKTSVKHHS